MPKYRKKPVEVEVEEWWPMNHPGDPMCGRRKPGRFYGQVRIESNGKAMIGTLEGPHEITPGDFIIRGIRGEFYPCKPDIFPATYEKVEE